MLAGALAAFPKFRIGGMGRMSDEDYVAAGRRANQEALAGVYSDDLFQVLRAGEHLDDILQVPYALAHIKDVHSAMQLAVAAVGESREDLTAHPLFHPAFAAFVLGFSIGFVTAHRHKAQGKVQELPPRTIQYCEDWGVSIALFYLVKVEASGIMTGDTDRLIYGIENKWRLVSDERRLEPFARLNEVTAEARAAGESWFHDESIEMGPTLMLVLQRFYDAYPGKLFS